MAGFIDALLSLLQWPIPRKPAPVVVRTRINQTKFK